MSNMKAKYNVNRHQIIVSLILIVPILFVGILSKLNVKVNQFQDRDTVKLSEARSNTSHSESQFLSDEEKYREMKTSDCIGASTFEMNENDVIELTVDDVTCLQDVDAKVDTMKLLLPTLANFRSPCWYERLPAVDPYHGDDHLYVKYHHREGALNSRYYELEESYRANIKVNVELFRERCARGEAWRLRCMPAVYIIGVFKSGTTSFWVALLRNQADIAGPTRKEPLYWNNVRTGGGLQCFGWPDYIDVLPDVPTPRSFGAYVDLFDSVAERNRLKTITDKENKTLHPTIIVEGSTTYLTEYNSWHRLPGNQGLAEPRYILADILKSLTPGVKIIALVRNPADRLYSHYLFYEKTGAKTPEEFDSLARKSLDMMTSCLRVDSLRRCVYNVSKSCAQPIAIKHSLYFPFIRDWLTVFGENLLVINSDDYFKSPVQSLHRVFDFLALPFVKEMKVKEGPSNPNKHEKCGNMWNSTRELLTSFYRPYNRMLADLLGDTSFLWDPIK